MEIERFKALVARLENESAAAPRAYRIRVAGLALLGFGILLLLLAAVGSGIAVLAGIAIALAFSGGAALLLLAKLGKLLFLLAVPLWYLVKAGVQALFVRLPTPGGRPLTAAEAPALFAALDGMRRRMRGPRFHQVLLTDDLNAAVVQRPAFGIVGPARNHLLLGLPLLEALGPDEALSVVAHEYGHLAGSHGHFSAYIYRLRLTWGTVQSFADQVQGWLGRLVAPLVRWYAPYFNAYTFVLARHDEYLADAASAELVGAAHASHALKRINLVGPRHADFMRRTFERVADDDAPPADLARRWAAQLAAPAADGDVRRWLGDALDREGRVDDTHPTLRARLQALPDTGEPADRPPPPLPGPSAAEAWLGAGLDALRDEAAAQWAAAVDEGWRERHAEVRKDRERLATLRALPAPDTDEQFEQLRLSLALERDTDWRDPIAAFNAAHPDHAPGLFLEARARLDRDDAAGVALMERVIALDADATKPACECVHAYLLRQGDTAAAEPWAERWRARDRWENERTRQLSEVTPDDALAAHGLDAAALAAVRAHLASPAAKGVTGAWLARRTIAADPGAGQWILGLRMGFWTRRRGRQGEVLKRLAALDWPVPLYFVSLDGRFAKMRARLEALDGAQLR